MSSCMCSFFVPMFLRDSLIRRWWSMVVSVSLRCHLMRPSSLITRIERNDESPASTQVRKAWQCKASLWCSGAESWQGELGRGPWRGAQELDPPREASGGVLLVRWCGVWRGTQHTDSKEAKYCHVQFPFHRKCAWHVNFYLLTGHSRSCGEMRVPKGVLDETLSSSKDIEWATTNHTRSGRHIGNWSKARFLWWWHYPNIYCLETSKDRTHPKEG